MVDRAFENPAMSGGLVVMALTATAIMSNAMFLQNGRHPEPLFNTRPQVATREQPRAPAMAPIPATRPQPLPQAVQPPPAAAPRVMPPVPQPKPVAATPQPAPVAAVNPQVALTSATQRELARLGVYMGAIDGALGSRTRGAIASFQTAAGLKASGEPSPELLATLRQSSAQPVAAAPPPAPAVEAAKPDQVAAAVQRAAELEREQAAARQGDRLRRIQMALDLIGYGPLPTDGQPTPATPDAIRRFEPDNGLPVTGEPGDKVIVRLVTIGAIKAN